MTKKFRFGFNTYAPRIGNEDVFYSVVRDMKPAYMMVIDDTEEKVANRLQSINTWGMEIIYRKYDPRDGNEWREEKPESYAVNFMKWAKNKQWWYYIVNEPNATTLADVTRMSEWLAKVSEILLDNGYKIIVGNYAPGVFDMNNIDNGGYDPLLKVASANPLRMKIGIHEYASLGLWMGVGTKGWNTADITKPQYMSDWHTLDTVIYADGTKLGDYRHKRIPTTYHLLRYHWLQRRAMDVLKLPDKVKFIQTEFGWAQLDDVNRISPNPYKIIENVYSIPAPYTKGANGIYSLANAYKAWFPNKTHAQMIVEQLKWADALYDDDCDGFLIFDWDDGGDWDKQYGMHMGRDAEFHALMTDWSRKTLASNTPPVVTPPEDDGDDTPAPTEPELPTVPTTISLTDARWKKAFMSSVSATGSNVRQSPSVGSIRVGSVTKDTSILIILEAKHQASDGVWYPVRLNTSPLMTHETGDYANFGWVRADVVTYRYYEPPPVVIPEDNEIGVVTIEYEYNLLNEKHVAVHEAIFNLVDLMDLEGVDIKTTHKQK